ncbi:MAG: YidC/Oxa1 family membrane protein insertase [Patescibacteria group bacterium]
MSFISSFVGTILVSLYQVTGNLGVSIILFTILLRLILLPLSVKSLKAQKEVKKIQPELKKLQKKHGKNKKAYQQAQVKLYKKYNVNPLAGCLPQVVQIIILIILYRVFINFLGQESINGIDINPLFLWFDLRKNDVSYVLPALAALSQLFFSVMLLPGGEIRDIIPNKSKSKKIQKENKKEEDVADMAQSMQKQMMFMMPLMTGVFAARFPSGLALYWVVSTVASIFQQFFISGPGGLESYSKRALFFIKSKF